MMERRDFIRSAMAAAFAPAAVTAILTRRIEPTGVEHPANFIDLDGVRGYLGSPEAGFIHWDGTDLLVSGVPIPGEVWA